MALPEVSARLPGAGPIAPEIVNAGGASSILLVCEHASNDIPARYEGLGIDPEVAASHVAWDPGAYAISRGLSERLDAQLVASRVSRLVYDCNRPPDSPDAMPEKSEIHEIPGNLSLSPAEKRERTENIYHPFRDALTDVIYTSEWLRALVTIHSFTPVYHGAQRELHLGILHDEDSRLADTMLEIADQFTALDVRRNEPYGPQNGVAHTLIEHGQSNGLPNVMIEIRNDLLAAEQDRVIVSDLLAKWLTAACEKLGIPLVGKGPAAGKEDSCPE